MQEIHLQQKVREGEYDTKTKRNSVVYAYLVTKTINKIEPRIGEVLTEREVCFLLGGANSSRGSLQAIVIN